MFETPTFEDDVDFIDDLPRDNRGRLQGDETLTVNFYMRAVQNHPLSVAEGRKIFQEMEFVKIFIKGDKYNQIDTYANDAYKQRFPNEYKRFKAKATEGVIGTPIAHFPNISVSQVAEFNAMNIRTVEDLATLPDSVKGIMGFQDMKRKAQAFISSSRDEAIASKAEETNNRLQALELKLAQKDAEIAALQAPAAKKRTTAAVEA